jgi:hypothetical protein
MMDKKQKLFRNGQQVDILYRWVRDSKTLIQLPELVKQVVSENMWREHLYEKTGEMFSFDNFQEFVETHPPDGLGSNIKTLLHLCREDTVVLAMIDEVIQNGNVKGYKSDFNVNTADDVEAGETAKKTPSSSKELGLRKLRQHAENNKTIAKLRDKVLAGEMTVNAALIESGLRIERVTIPKTIDKAAEALKKTYTKDELKELVKQLQR